MGNNNITVKILSKEFQVSCPENKEDELFEAANYLDQKMRDIRNSGRIAGLERITIMAALNITHELLMHRQNKDVYVQNISQQLERLQKKLDEALIGNTHTER